MTTPDDKNKKSAPEEHTNATFLPRDADDIALSDDPFSDEFEVTVMETNPHPQADDDITELTGLTGLTKTEMHAQHSEERDDSVSQSFAEKRIFAKKFNLKKLLLVAIPIALIILPIAFNKSLRQIWLAWHSDKTTLSGTQIPRDKIPLRLGRLVITHPDNKPPQFLSIKAGTNVGIEVPVVAWDNSSNQNLNLIADLQIYDPSGILVFAAPHSTGFSGKADPNLDNLIVGYEINFASGTPPGSYRVMVAVTKKDSLQTAIAQTKILVTK